MDDLISRQAAIHAALEDVSGKRTHEFNAGATRAANRIKRLPSAQPATSCSEIPNSSDDTISRQAALDAFGLSEKTRKYGGDHSGYDTRMLYEIQDTLESLPAVQTDHVADIGKKVDGDCISRQAVVKFFNDWISCLDENCHHQSVADMTIIKNDFKNLPSAQPEQVCVATVTLTDDQVKGVVEKAKNAVISVIEPELHWIPCSERLPKEKQSVLVTDGSVVWVCDIISTDEGYKWEDSHGYWLDLAEWTAWMPLPEPYKGGDAE